MNKIVTNKIIPHVLSIRHLNAWADEKPILQNINLQIKSGELHVIMGPNGSGKSTLAQVVMGNPAYRVSKSTETGNHNKEFGIFIDQKDITFMPTEDRARLGVFLAFQSPIAIPGVTIMNLLRTSYEEIYPLKHENGINQKAGNTLIFNKFKTSNITIADFISKTKEYARKLNINENLLTRGVNDGFSGGEKKKIEMLQALILEPKFVIFDEIDTGLDIDALKLVGQGIYDLKTKGVGVIVITHYQRIISYLKPDVVHVLVGGGIVESGGNEIINMVEKNGFSRYKNTK
jgi:Fe-S cluster assembly ATP-binding protein